MPLFFEAMVDVTIICCKHTAYDAMYTRCRNYYYRQYDNNIDKIQER